MLKEINNYINDKSFKLSLYKDKLNIVNYKKILSLEENYISILIDNKKIIIKGNNLYLVKILDNELLIKGNIKSIEAIDE